jgi:hypothetical protein
VNIKIRHCIDDKKKILHNQTVELYLTEKFYNNQLIIIHPKKIENRLLLETWKNGFVSWFLYKNQYFSIDLTEMCYYFEILDLFLDI